VSFSAEAVRVVRLIDFNIVDARTETVLRQAHAEAPGDAALANQRHVLAALLALD
jgi:hypothetical protein